jgi:uncharacterized protein (TIGR00369 family)
MMQARTHNKIDPSLSGEIIELNENEARVKLLTTLNMITDDSGLVHGGFIFSLADYAAMICVNHPNVVLASANVKFTKPVMVGAELIAEATVNKQIDNKFEVQVQVWDGPDEAFYGEFLCIVTGKHVLS